MTTSEATARRVLVAEDDEPTLRALGRLLTTWGYEVVLVGDGAKAWDVLRGDHPPGVAVLDWGMPGVDGLEVCRRARGLLALPLPYLILLTGRGGRDDLVAGLEGGADEYLPKPVDPVELRARIGAGWRLVELQSRLAEQVRRLEATPPVREVVDKDHPGLRQTLRLCVAAFTETLSLPSIPRHLRVALRTCRGLCLEGLDEPDDGERPSAVR